MKRPFVILFAGPVGSSKSTISNYLSWNLNLPIFCNDSVRKEIVLEGKDAEGDDYLKKRNDYLEEIFEKANSFILDASIDRSWGELKEKLEKSGYDYFIISLDISKGFLKNILKNYNYNKNNIDINHQEHQDFLNRNKEIVNISINDKNYTDRLEIALNSIRRFIKNR